MDAPTGPVIGRLRLPATGGTGQFVEMQVPLAHAGGRHDLYFVPAEAAPEPSCRLDWVEFHQ
jgi:hypothetical protein